MKPLLSSSCTAVSALGSGLAATRAALQKNASGLSACDFLDATLDTQIGRVSGLEAFTLPADLADYDCRNNRLAVLALQQDGFAQAVAQAAVRWGKKRVGVFLGTSTSGILETELAWRRRDGHGALPPDFNYRGAHALSSLAACVRCALDLQGPAWTASTACSSSAKVFASAARLIEAGLIDAAVVGGVDTLCLTTLYGFSSLELTSQQPCRPYDAERHGISIGEAAAFLLLERADAPIAGNAVFLSGYGESSDAWHMSSPHPEGIGARQAMADALRRAGRLPCDIGYLNLHGTGTLANDLSEGRAVKALFGAATPPCSSTKGATGHTLGAAGALEAVFSILALQDGKVWGSPGTRQVDAAIGLASYALTPRDAPVAHVLSNSLGFGGTNCALVFSRKEALCA